MVADYPAADGHSCRVRCKPQMLTKLCSESRSKVAVRLSSGEHIGAECADESMVLPCFLRDMLYVWIVKSTDAWSHDCASEGSQPRRLPEEPSWSRQHQPSSNGVVTARAEDKPKCTSNTSISRGSALYSMHSQCPVVPPTQRMTRLSMEMNFKSSCLGPRVPLALTMKIEQICPVHLFDLRTRSNNEKIVTVMQELDTVWSLRTGLEGARVMKGPFCASFDFRYRSNLPT